MTLLRPSLLLALAACAAPVDPAALPAHEVAPPGTPVLTLPRLVAGRSATVQVSDAFPGDTVWLAGSRQGLGAGSCPPFLRGQCFGILNPVQQLGNRVANGQGQATWTLPVPAGAVGAEMCLQAVDPHAGNIYLSAAVCGVVEAEVRGCTRLAAPNYDAEANVDDGSCINGALDPDADGLNNAVEWWLGTNPNAVDSDSDGQSDAAEAAARTNPRGDVPLSNNAVVIAARTTWGQQTLQMPRGCYQIDAQAWGAGGGTNWEDTTNGGDGGGGGYATLHQDTWPRDTWELFVGQGGNATGMSPNAFGGAPGGTTCHFGGGGGGSTEARSGGQRLLVAGGGGGSGNNSTTGFGGAGGGAVGQTGGDGYAAGSGGLGGDSSGLVPAGEDASDCGSVVHAGAGGGGWSGGGAATAYGGGGGGGSSHGDTTQAGNGREPGNAANARGAGWGGIAPSDWAGVGPKQSDGRDGRLTMVCRFPAGLPVDADRDGLHDQIEWLSFGASSRSGDTDGDGLSDGDEVLQHGTRPNRADTDGDGLTDREEIQLSHTDPLLADMDGDGLNDRAEVMQHGTDPADPDSDDDGLSDPDEVNVFHSDPLSADTDADGLDNLLEATRHFTALDNPDTDGDTLSDGDEVNTHGTEPLAADSDSDGLSDAGELTRGTDPTSRDGDSDGLYDGQEVLAGTSTTDPDSDNDGWTDGEEVEVRPLLNPMAPPVHTMRWDAWGQQTYVVPAGCTALEMHAWGAGGGQNWDGSGNGTVGGGGAWASSLRQVTPGQVFDVYVGQGGNATGMSAQAFGGAMGGTTDHFGGGGGGSSEVRFTDPSGVQRRVVVAGGGGGSGNNGSTGNGGPGGGERGGDGGTGYDVDSGGRGGRAAPIHPDGADVEPGGTVHAGAGGGGYDGGGAPTAYGGGGGGGSSWGDELEAGSGREPGNAHLAGDAGWGGVPPTVWASGPNQSDGTDGAVELLCHAAIGSIGGTNPLNPGSHP